MYAKAKSRIMRDIRDLVAIIFLVNRPGSKYIKIPSWKSTAMPGMLALTLYSYLPQFEGQCQFSSVNVGADLQMERKKDLNN